MTTVRGSLAFILAIATISSGCSTAPATFSEWCASVSAQDCIEMAREVAWGTVDPVCVMRTASADEASACFGRGTTETTVPTGTVIAVSPPRDSQLIDQAVEDTVLAAHPEAIVDVGVVFAPDVPLETARQLAHRFGTEVMAVWRADQVCVPAWGGFPGTEPSRFAWVDGVERAAAERKAAAEGRTVVTGHHIAESAWSRMEEEASALVPGTQLVAMAIHLPVAQLTDLRQDERVTRTRIIPYWVETSFDDQVLPAPTPLTCDAEDQ